ncbi:hypothetical protein GQ43DRAFT_434637 [Delitschia confertaspora ATCC 74209]|uniref:3-hydroxyisobutyrate dehydrogenase n=1 Tax=Delitschia confertaspora ATCC 74209 TaxID=1513339 RepID=A0A9P4JHD5_9PLEO|nr:hypothetical protein GQ43DRAFT_434637 [Delitschia confertaspora ATCC 74209]
MYRWFYLHSGLSFYPSCIMASFTISYIGLGRAGFPMAACLGKKGYKLMVRDADLARVDKFIGEYPQCRRASSEADVFQECEVVITMLPDGLVVRDVLLGQNGIARYLNAGTVVIDTSSSSPFDTRELVAELTKLSIDLVDSPITQEQLHSIDTGGATLIWRWYIIALCDTLVAGQKLGLNPQQMIDVLNVGTGVNFLTKYSMKNLKSYDTGYQLELLIKDVKIAKDVIEKSGFDSELPPLALTYLEDAINYVESAACHSECIKAWEKRAGVEIEKTGQTSSDMRKRRIHKL